MRWKALMMLTALCSIGSASALATDPPPSRRLVIEVTATQPGQEQTFRAALGYEGRLEIIEARTPFKKELSAKGLTLMFEVLDQNGSVVAQLCGERDGKMTLFGNVGGRSGKITDEPWNQYVTSSFGGF